MNTSFPIKAKVLVRRQIFYAIFMTHNTYFSVTISESISAQPAVNKTYPILPSAPLQEQAYQNYGSISENIQSQPAVHNIVILPANACPICRIGKFDSHGVFFYLKDSL